MALTRKQKEEAVAHLTQTMSLEGSAVFMSFSGLGIKDVNELRDAFFREKCFMRVVPKRLLRIVTQNAHIPFNPMMHEGQVAVVGGTDAVAPARILKKFIMEHPNITMLGGLLNGLFVDRLKVEELSMLPSREGLLSMLLNVLQGSARGFVVVLVGVPRSLVYVLSAIKTQKEGLTT